MVIYTAICAAKTSINDQELLLITTLRPTSLARDSLQREKTDKDSRARERRRHDDDDDDSHRLRYCGVARVARNPMHAKKALHTNPRKATVEIEINGCQNFSYILLNFPAFFSDASMGH
jgi:hypothetical protein